MIESGESAAVEFKSTARLNLHTGEQDQAIIWAVVKTIAAFMNTNGGTLLVGVDDDGRPVGVESDYPFVKGKDRDGWELSLTTAVKNALGPVAATDLVLGFSTLEGRTVARIDVRPGAEPVFATKKGEQREVFFARLNNSSEEISGPSAAVLPEEALARLGVGRRRVQVVWSRAGGQREHEATLVGDLPRLVEGGHHRTSHRPGPGGVRRRQRLTRAHT